MGNTLMESQSASAAADNAGSVILDIESLTQAIDNNCSGSSKATHKALSRKASSRTERRKGEEQDAEEATKKPPAKGAQAMASIISDLSDAAAGDGRVRRFSRFPPAINPKRILLLLATTSSVGSIILIYFTLAIYRRGGA